MVISRFPFVVMVVGGLTSIVCIDDDNQGYFMKTKSACGRNLTSNIVPPAEYVSTWKDNQMTNDLDDQRFKIIEMAKVIEIIEMTGVFKMIEMIRPWSRVIKMIEMTRVINDQKRRPAGPLWTAGNTGSQ